MRRRAPPSSNEDCPETPMGNSNVVARMWLLELAAVAVRIRSPESSCPFAPNKTTARSKAPGQIHSYPGHEMALCRLRLRPALGGIFPTRGAGGLRSGIDRRLRNPYGLLRRPRRGQSRLVIRASFFVFGQ